MLSIPEEISKAQCVGEPVSFEWDYEISTHYAYDEEIGVRMAKTFDKANYRTIVTLEVCIFEWFVRRFEGMMDLTDAYHRLEAAYACAINPNYLNADKFEDIELESTETRRPADVLQTGIYRIWKPLKLCYGAQVGLAGDCVNLTLLTHYVMSDPNRFDKWLEASLRKGAKIFPREVDSYDVEANFYNYGVEKIVPREFFFDPDFEYSEDAATTVLQEFLDSLDPKKNPYLQTAKQMKADGYTRTPYKIIDLKMG